MQWEWGDAGMEVTSDRDDLSFQIAEAAQDHTLLACYEHETPPESWGPCDRAR